MMLRPIASASCAMRRGEAASCRPSSSVPSPFAFTDAEVKRDFAVSKDGTRVPVSHSSTQGRHGRRQQRTCLYGYGRYGISMAPYFSPLLRLWLATAVSTPSPMCAEAANTASPGISRASHQSRRFRRLLRGVLQLLIDKATRTRARRDHGRQQWRLLMGRSGPSTRSSARGRQRVGIYDPLRWELQPNGEFM